VDKKTVSQHFNIKYHRDDERHFYSISLTDEHGLILAQACGIDENTTLHMFISLAASALLNVKTKTSLNDRLSLLERFASEIAFKRNNFQLEK
jgi:hypothetical protein